MFTLQYGDALEEISQNKATDNGGNGLWKLLRWSNEG